MNTKGTFASGSLVKARGREWVVLPESDEDLLLLKPLGGTEEEIAGIYLPLETVEPAHFSLPDPSDLGDYRSARMLRNAVRLGFRNSAGPFRCFGSIAVEPRPYQLVPLLMGLKLDPIRLLIADDVGVGKTIEACLILKELLSRGEIERFTVLCPAHLAEQWQGELSRKFHINAELVLPGSVRKLEAHCNFNESVFEKYPYTIVSLDYIKSDRHRSDFLRACPEMVIVDEAHGCAFAGARRGGRHQRHRLIKELSESPDRHMIFVTATPHSGNEEAFRSLLAFLKPKFMDLPPDLTGPHNEHQRRELAQYMVQRTRGDIQHFMTETAFPKRMVDKNGMEPEEHYLLHPEYMKLFEKVLNYARGSVQKTTEHDHRSRVRYWSALALLRSLASSPAAAAATLRNRAIVADTVSVQEADEIGRRTVLDLDLELGDEAPDIIPGGEIGEFTDDSEAHRKKLLGFAREADKLKGEADYKLDKAVKLVKQFLKDGYSPIIFCRFIDTAEYVASEFRKKLGKKVSIEAVTGLLPPAERDSRVQELGKTPKRVLVCTDCLSEGINLQEHFDAVMHYDLSWNPMRHEQRAGRVDRFGQPKPNVKILTYYGRDNGIDTKVLEVLLRKHSRIRSTLGISVPVPAKANEVIEALMESLLMGQGVGDQMLLTGFEEYMARAGNNLFTQWEEASKREKRSRTMFAQETIKVDEVARELDESKAASGTGTDVEAFVRDAIQAHKGRISGTAAITIDLSETPRALRDSLNKGDKHKAQFTFPVPDGVEYLFRTNPFVENLASYVMDTALDPLAESAARRCGVIRTSRIIARTTLLLLRFRYHITTIKQQKENRLLAEECHLLAYRGSPSSPEWLSEEEAIELLELKPESNIPSDQSQHFLRTAIDGFKNIEGYINTVAAKRGEELLKSHSRVRKAARMKGLKYKVEPKLPVDLLGVYLFLPTPKGEDHA